ncbi:CDP-alcohol phosphatidyltransferase family protein [Kineothrix sp. MB12-C1]|uniref:CDP-alcohol phosphatidyltransferase family protein n=1 Tax=Kineothrix sp. MB12-C1 TaxID=3070215 RepID=UPI0027D311F9|nr:CDP-alcohol phosphatidyltransferase family protein [Kineothrix sp. MB12-C1]WMC92581.1 CDP-alcohol phosphatidyltransferase family protein [Kineothrix sp. MB12-C1]
MEVRIIKNVPNGITVIRIFASISMLFIKPFSSLFFFFYIICGISDVLDGYIARKMNICSKFGQILDSLADLLFIGVVLLICIPVINLPFQIICWVAAIAIVRLFSIILGFVRYRQLAFLHTYTNKMTGMILFFFPFLFFILGKEAAAIIICSIASISAIEELLINLTSKMLHRDIVSIFSK